MRYYSSECPVLSATDGVSYEISVTGCHFHCHNCQNPELQNFSLGKLIDDNLTNYIIKDIHKYYDSDKIDNIDLIGGEPLDQDHDELVKFLSVLRSEFPKLGIWIYTGHEIDEVKTDILQLCDYIKCGQYVEELRSNNGFKSEYGPVLITSNQYIVKTTDELSKRGVL